MRLLPCFLIAACLLPDTGQAGPPPERNIEAGRHAFMVAGCYQCHGTVGQGGVGPKLAPDPLPPEAMIAFVRYSSRNMPAYPPGIVSDADLRLINDYLRSIASTPGSGPP